MGAFYLTDGFSTRIKVKAITATARKIAVLFYNDLHYGMDYITQGPTRPVIVHGSSATCVGAPRSSPSNALALPKGERFAQAEENVISQNVIFSPSTRSIIRS